VLGVVVGIAELVSRYRDAPKEALYTRPALLYVALNLAASVLALALIRAYDWKFGATGAAVEWTQVMVGGIGAMALFRTSLFTVRAGDRDIGVGPGSFLQIFRDAADREVDRLRAQARGSTIGQLMQGLHYSKASAGLIPYCLALMQNLPDEDQQKLVRAVLLLDKESIDDDVKVLILGLHLINAVGPDVLKAAVKALGDKLK